MRECMGCWVDDLGEPETDGRPRLDLVSRLLAAGITVLATLHVTSIKDSVKHYHRECTEVYYILQGRGKMELNDDVIDVEPGTDEHG